MSLGTTSSTFFGDLAAGLFSFGMVKLSRTLVDGSLVRIGRGACFDDESAAVVVGRESVVASECEDLFVVVVLQLFFVSLESFFDDDSPTFGLLKVAVFEEPLAVVGRESADASERATEDLFELLLLFFVSVESFVDDDSDDSGMLNVTFFFEERVTGKLVPSDSSASSALAAAWFFDIFLVFPNPMYVMPSTLTKEIDESVRKTSYAQ